MANSEEIRTVIAEFTETFKKLSENERQEIFDTFFQRGCFVVQDRDDLIHTKSNGAKNEDLNKQLLEMIVNIDPSKKPLDILRECLHRRKPLLAEKISWDMSVYFFCCYNLGQAEDDLLKFLVPTQIILHSTNCFHYILGRKEGIKDSLLEKYADQSLDSQLLVELLHVRIKMEEGLAKEDPEELLREFNKILEQVPKCENPHYLFMKTLSLKGWALFEMKKIREARKLFEFSYRHMCCLAECQETCVYLFDSANFYLSVSNSEQNYAKADKLIDEARIQAEAAREVHFDPKYDLILTLNVINRLLGHESDRVYNGTWSTLPKKAYNQEYLAEAERLLNDLEIRNTDNKYSLSLWVDRALVSFQKQDFQMAKQLADIAVTYAESRPPAYENEKQNITNWRNHLAALSRKC